VEEIKLHCRFCEEIIEVEVPFLLNSERICCPHCNKAFDSDKYKEAFLKQRGDHEDTNY